MKKLQTKKNVIISIFVLILIGLLYNCTGTGQKNEAVLVGKIINSKKDYIVISKDPFDSKSDTLKIEKGNKLKGKIKLEDEGLFFIYIFPEFQVLYIKPGDSLAFIINTNEFDESLSFSGTSGFENNLLMNIFLMNEKENYSVRKKINSLSPVNLKKLLDSSFSQKQKFIDGYKEELGKTSAKFKKILNLFNRISQYRIKEFYSQKSKNKLPDNFYDYRKILMSKLPETNIPDLIYFAKNFIDGQLKSSKNKNKNYRLIELIDNNIKETGLKDILYMLYCKNYIQDKFITNKNDDIIQKYVNKISNKNYINVCLKSIDKNNTLKTGNIIPNINVTDLNGKTSGLNQLLKNKKTILSFWDFYYRKNFKINLEKLLQLKSKYPDLNILILNVNSGSFQEWKLEVPKKNGLYFYQINSDVKKILPENFSKVYLLDSTVIKQSMVNMYSPDFNSKLEEFLSR